MLNIKFINNRFQGLPIDFHIKNEVLEESLDWHEEYITGEQIIEKVFHQNKKQITVIKIGEDIKDINVPIKVEGLDEITLVGIESQTGIEVLRHTTAHVMAYAIKKIFPKVKISIGPVIQDGFYYDLDEIEVKIEDFKAIEKEMRKIIAEKLPNLRKEITRKQALEIFKDEPYKIELINDLPVDEVISIYHMGDFVDLCRGPHLPNTSMIKAFKLMRIAGAYWRGNSKNKMLTRIYGVGFPTETQLKEYLERLKLAEKRDHNKLGKSMDIFINHELVGQGLPLLTQKGAMIKRLLERFVEDEETRRGYDFTLTPYLTKSDLFKTSGHWELYKESMFVIQNEEEELALRPMTCPFHFCLYNSKKRSYRDLPIRYAETSTMFRNESSGEMHGLIRLRQFTLSDGHIICTEAQLAEEFKSCLDLNRFYLNKLGFKDYWFRLSKWDPQKKEKYIDNPIAWDQSQNAMKKILDEIGVEYIEATDEAAFYGPKLDLQMKNVYGKEDTIMTIQLDFAMAKRFSMTYTDEKDQEQIPMIIHRSSLGCYERTIALLIEHYAGKFPFWISPVQVTILTINEHVHDYAKTIEDKLKGSQIRTTVNNKGQSLGKKVRDAQLEKIPYILSIGEHEKTNQIISIRTNEGKIFKDYSFENFIQLCKDANQNQDQFLNL